jgi:hypothetical protein
MTFLLVKRGVVFGAAYGLVAMVVLMLYPQVAQWLGIYAGSTASPTVAAFMLVFGPIAGALLGLFLAVLSGIAVGLVLGLLVRSSMYRSSSSESRRTWIGILTGATGGLVALATTFSWGAPSSLAPSSPILGCILLVIVPPIIVFSVVWRETNKLLPGNGTAHL